ncbi:PE-PPE domain-containing protein [Rhodococcus sp. MEB041]|uniref:PE-PPE domain-containing protein n=1 Tax=Rhodococcus sp. MEB041 TaxID=3040323 RepID=UPI00254CB0BB|nr:PE-PPE domain-containing protein [Rhodococcus sp. MEB041]
MTIPVSVVCIGGTFETRPDDTAMTPVRGMLHEVTKHLPSTWRMRWVPYPGTYGNGLDYSASVREGVARAADIAREESRWNPVMVLGYSQGGDIAARLANGITSGLFDEIDCAGAGLLADPGRAQGQLAHFGDDGTTGIIGARPVSTALFPVWSMAAPRDPISRLPIGSPLRSIADMTALMSTRPGSTGPWLDDLGRKIREGRMQQWWNPANWRSWNGALDQLANYTLRGRHTVYGSEICPGTDVTYTKRLAQLMIGARR